MKKILVGCLIVFVIALAGLGVAGFYAFRWARPMIESTSTYLERAREMSRLGDRITNKSTYPAPANGELTPTQVERFVAVQTRVRDELGTRWADIEAKAAQLHEKTKNQRDLTFAEFTTVFSDLAGIYMEARRAQVNALNVQKFSDDEYTWVRRRVYEAAGMEIAGSIDMSKIEELAREGGLTSSVTIPEMAKPNVPDANIKLVKPHLAKIKEWVPMAVLGL